MGYISVPHAYGVVDCPDHPSSALLMATGRRFCFHCGRMVQVDVLGSGRDFTIDAPEDLKAEARDAWNASQVVRDFAGSMQRERGATPIRAAS